MQKSSILAEFFRKKIFERLKCTVAPFFLRLKGAESSFFKRFWGPKSPKYRFFGRISNVVKWLPDVLNCSKLPFLDSRRFVDTFWYLGSAPRTHIHASTSPWKRVDVDHFSSKNQLFSEKNFFSAKNHVISLTTILRLWNQYVGN